MKYFDISWPISEHITAYKDKKIVQLIPTKTFVPDHVNETLITIGSHTGTHIDAPSHFIADGKTIDDLDPLCCTGKAKVVDMTHVTGFITKKDIEHITDLKDYIVLFKTKNSFLDPYAPFDPNFIYITADAAQYLVEQKIKAIGIDYLGIERNQTGHPTHRAFMQQNIAIIEGLRLQHIKARNYFLWCLPIKIPGLDAAPARAILMQQGS